MAKSYIRQRNGTRLLSRYATSASPPRSAPSRCHHLHHYPWCTTPDCPRGPERHERHATVEETDDET